MPPSYDLIIVGAGIVGLATAMSAAAAFPQLRILVVDKEPELGAHQSSHNSGVIHSGVYYRPRSLKAQLCVRGAAAMVAFCREHGIAHEVCGKVIVATGEEQLSGLHDLHRRAVENGVRDAALIGPERLRELEPHARGIAALHVPGTAITDFAAVARKYAEILTSGGGEIQTSAQVLAIHHGASRFTLETNRGEFSANFLINCAGLHSDRIARMAGASLEAQIVPFRGEYFELAGQSRTLVRSLIYPVPDPRFPFLGVHFTRRVTGQIEAGPNAVLALKREGYRKRDLNLHDLLETLRFPGFWRMARKYGRLGAGEMYRSFSKLAFLRSLQQLVPEVQAPDLVFAGSGVRAQALSRDGSLLDDFYFLPDGKALHVCNVPSPAATASLLIGKTVAQMAAQHFGLPPTSLPVQSLSLPSGSDRRILNS